jgi:Spy/CpxP family protein refolding chaperone
MDRNATNKTRRLVFSGILGLAMMSLVPLSAQAWGRGGRGPSPEKAVGRLTQELNLTAEQQAQVKQILEEGFAKRREARETYRSEMQTLRNETKAKLEGVLTADQVTKLHQLRDERKDRRRCREEEPAPKK